jgi:sulfur-oxidizing protein SoxY
MFAGDVMTAILDRRQFMLLGTATALALPAMPAFAALEDVERELAEFARGAEPREGRISLEIAESVDNGANVPVSISVDSAMEGDDMVDAVILLAPANPRPIIATFHFTPLSGAASVSTRVRLAATQEVMAAARMRDGSVHVVSRAVTVAVGGCVG